jgi:hypothetical protein
LMIDNLTMKTIVSFYSAAHPIPDGETPITPGREIAHELAIGLSSEGFRLESSAPIEGEGGWSVWVRVPEASLSLFLNIAGLGRPVKNRWVLSVLHTGVFGWIRSRGRTAAMERTCAAVDNVLRRLGCSDLEWWDDSAFERALEGKPARERETRAK